MFGSSGPRWTRGRLNKLRRYALRRCLWLKLNLEERGLVTASIKLLRRRGGYLRNPGIIELLNKIAEEIGFLANGVYELVLDMGRKLVIRQVAAALKLGYKRAAEWLKDKAYIFYLGTLQIHTPPGYRAEI